MAGVSGQTSHLCLVGDEAIPNITPLLDSNFKPSVVYLLVAPQYREMAGYLSDTFSQLGVKQQSIELESAWDLEHIRDQLMLFMEGQKNRDIILNISAGTRPMMLAAHEVFQAYDKPIFHVHPQTDHVVWLSSSNREGFDLQDKLKLREFLLARGSVVTGSPMRNKVSMSRQKLTEEIVRCVQVFSSPLKILNYLASASEHSLKSPQFDITQDSALSELIALFEAEGICRLEDKSLYFRSEEDRFYCNGGWLEEYAYSQILALKEQLPIQDVAMGVEIERPGLGNKVIRNELDVAFLADNQFYLMECKTRNFRHKKGKNNLGAETLYKLDSIVDLLAGTTGHGMLVSYFPLSKWDKQRAADLGLLTCVGNELGQLQSMVKSWVENKGLA